MANYSRNFFVFLCSIALVLGFVPSSNKYAANSKMSLQMAVERSRSVPFLLKPALLDGSMAGDEGFDPLGLSTINDLGVDLYWLREAELKHCRISMLAVVGALAQEVGFILPGQPVGKNQIDVFWQFWDRNPGPIYASFIFIGIIEILSGIAVTEGRKSGARGPGEFGFNPLNFGKTPASAKDLALKEVRNGRLAMFAAAGILLQAATTHEGALENLF